MTVKVRSQYKVRDNFMSSRHDVVSSFRYALYSPFLSSFDMESVTLFYLVRKFQCPSRNRTCGFPTSGSSMKLILRLTDHTAGALCAAWATDTV